MNGSGLKRAQTALALLVLVIGTATCRDAPSPTASLDRPSFIINGQPTGDNSFSNVGALLFDFDGNGVITGRSEEHTSELRSPCNLVCRLLLEKKKKIKMTLQPMNSNRLVSVTRHTCVNVRCAST